MIQKKFQSIGKLRISLSIFNIPFLPLIIGFVCVLVTSWPVFHSGFFRPHDYTHAARIVEMSRSLEAGEFPVRWSENFGFGYGMPLFNFYAPLPYYVAQIPYVLTHDAVLSIKFLYVLVSALAFTGMYLCATEFWEGKQHAGMIGAVVFTFATYRALDLYVRGAIGEVAAMVILPFALYGVLRMKKDSRIWVLITSVSLGAILLSHNLSGMISILIIFVFGLFYTRTKEFFISLVFSIALSIGISSFYILPAFFEKGYTRIEETITTGYFDYHNHFVALRQLLFGTWGYGGSVPGLEDGISFALGWLPISLCILAVASTILILLRNPKSKYQILKIAILSFFAAGSLFMATNKSVFIWDHVQTLKFMQFPWRFLGFAHVFLAILTGSSVLLLERKKYFASAFSVTVLVFALLLNAKFFTPEKYISDTDTYYATDEHFIQENLSKTLNDYLPKEISDDHLPEPSATRLAVTSPDTVLTTMDAPAKVVAQVKCLENCFVDINIFRFPGWTATVDGKATLLQDKTSFPTYSLSVPSGSHTISVQLEDTPIRRVGNILSIVSWVGIIFYYVTSRYALRR